MSLALSHRMILWSSRSKRGRCCAFGCQPGSTRLSILFDFAYAAPSGALLTRDMGPLPRHRSAEQSLLASLDVLDAVPGARSRANPASPYELADKVELRGMPVIRFIDDVLPELEFQPDIHITFDDELIAHEEASRSSSDRRPTAYPSRASAAPTGSTWASA